MRKYGFIGAGNMGGALCKACSKCVNPADIFIADHDEKKALALAESIGACTTDNRTIAEKCDTIFLGVKPQMMENMLSEISDILKARKDEVLLISMAAGLKKETICSLVGADMKVIRIMPNTPVGVAEGMVLYTANENTTNEEKLEFCSDMKYSGLMDELDESLFDAGTSVMGCGPAFVFLYMKALAEGGMKCGLPEEKALLYAMQVVKGAATLALNSDLDLDTLKVNVCSPGGSTIEGVKVLESSEFNAEIVEAVSASYKRNIELGKVD